MVTTKYFLMFYFFIYIGRYGALRHLQQCFIYIVAVSFIGGGNRSTRRKPQTCRESWTNLLSHNVIPSIYRWYNISGCGRVVYDAGHKAKRLVLQCINGVSSNPVEGRTKNWQLKDLILTLLGLIFRRTYIYI